MTRRIWAGLDVGVETTAVCIIDDSGEIVHQATCATALKDVRRELSCLRRRRHARVALEASTGTHLARGLRTHGYEVDLFEQRQLSKFLRLRRNKTDAGDAIGIANAARLGASTISKVHLKTLECQYLQSRLTIRRHLVRQRVASTNVLGRQLELYGGRLRCCSGTKLRSRVEAEMRAVFGRGSNGLTEELRKLLDRCEELIDHQHALDRELKRLALGNEVCCRFMEIPGVGPLCALSFYVTVGDPSRFARSADIGSYLGLTPRISQSGLSMRMGRISKMGSSSTRALLVGAGMKFMRFEKGESTLGSWAAALEVRRGRRKAAVGLGRKLATVMLAMWKSGESYEPRRSGRPLAAPASSGAELDLDKRN